MGRCRGSNIVWQEESQLKIYSYFVIFGGGVLVDNSQGKQIGIKKNPAQWEQRILVIYNNNYR